MLRNYSAQSVRGVVTSCSGFVNPHIHLHGLMLKWTRDIFMVWDLFKHRDKFTLLLFCIPSESVMVPFVVR